MNSERPYSLGQQYVLVTLRTLIGWHFLYEGFYKIITPAWSSQGVPIGRWTSTGYLQAATLFRWMIDWGLTPWIDNIVKISLLLIGFSLILGLFTRAGCIGALFLLALFYLASVPLAGTQQPGNEGAYLIVNKTLIEAAAVCVLLAFNTGAIAGFDLFFVRKNRDYEKDEKNEIYEKP